VGRSHPHATVCGPPTSSAARRPRVYVGFVHEPAKLVCPACGKEQVPQPECRRCGLIFSKTGGARSLFTARRLPDRGGKAPRAAGARWSMPRLAAGWLPVVAAAAFALGWGLRGSPTVDANEAAPEAKGAVAEPTDARASSAPGLSIGQLRALGDADEWSARGIEESARPGLAVVDDAPAPEAAPEAGSEAGALEPAPAPSASAGLVLAIPGEPPPLGTSAARLPATGAASPNDRYDPVGTRGWYRDVAGYEKALDERERSDGKALVVYFHAPWCPHCKRFRQDYLSHRAMRRFLDGAIRVHVDAESSPEAAGLATEWGVRGFPSFFVVPAGTERPERLHPFLGDVTLDPVEFAALADKVARGGVLPVPAMLTADGVRPAW